MGEYEYRVGSGPDAIFMGWERNLEGTRLALFTISAVEHPFYGSIVSERTLSNLNLQIPRIPFRESNVNEFRSSIKNGK